MIVFEKKCLGTPPLFYEVYLSLFVSLPCLYFRYKVAVTYGRTDGHIHRHDEYIIRVPYFDNRLRNPKKIG